MEQAIDGASKQLLALGLPGIMILALLWVCYRLFNLYVEAQNKRLDDAVSTTKVLGANTDALQRLTDLIRDKLK